MKIFETRIHWFKIFSSEAEIANLIAVKRTMKITVDGREICVCHSQEGFFAIQDSCPHNGFSLSMGYCSDDNAIVCPQHRYRFDLKTGRAKSGIGDAGRVYPIEMHEDGVYLGIEKTHFVLF